MLNRILGIDCSFTGEGGGITYIVELLNHAKPQDFGFDKVIIWANHDSLKKINNQFWLIKRSERMLSRDIFSKLFWKLFFLPRLIKKEKVNLLFDASGYPHFLSIPYVTICHNLLPFDKKEALRYGFSKNLLRFFILRLIHIVSFKKSSGLILLTDNSKDKVNKVVNLNKINSVVIPHGINKRFQSIYESRERIKNSEKNNFIYVSRIEPYKHQCNVMEAAHILRNKGYDFNINFVGPSNQKYLRKLKKSFIKYDPDKLWSFYNGPIIYEEIHEIYKKANIGIFASSCENLPITLLEMMSSGIPIACSNLSPMRDLLKDGGVYFDPEKPLEIAQALRKLIDSKKLRLKLGLRNYYNSSLYDWENTANSTFKYFSNLQK